MAYRYASNPSEAEDIAQDALLRAWRRRSTLRDGDRRNQWLATIVRNEAFRQHARVRPDPIATIEAMRASRTSGSWRRSSKPTSTPPSSRLPDKDRQLLYLRYDEDLTQAAIASRLGIPEGTVKVRLHRARDKLRRAFVPL